MMKRSVKAGIIAAGAAMLLFAAGCQSGANQTTAAPETTAAPAETTAAQGETAAQESTEAGSMDVATAEIKTEDYVADSTVELGDYEGIELKVSEVVVTDEDVDEQIKQVLEANAEYTEVDRAAKEGDQVNIDYSGKKDGIAFDGGTAEGFDLTLGSHSFIDGFEEGLVGTKAGDKKALDLTFPESYHAEDLAGQAVVFDVTVNAVKEKVLPELNEEFIAKVSPDTPTVEEYRESVRKTLVETAENTNLSREYQDVIAHLKEVSKVVPATKLVDDLYNQQINRAIITASNYGLDLGSYVSYVYGMDEDGFKSELRSECQDMAEVRLLYNAVAEKEGITVEDQDLEEVAVSLGYESYAAMIEQAQVSEELVKNEALGRKVLDTIIEKANVTVEKAE